MFARFWAHCSEERHASYYAEVPPTPPTPSYIHHRCCYRHILLVLLLCVLNVKCARS